MTIHDCSAKIDSFLLQRMLLLTCSAKIDSVLAQRMLLLTCFLQTFGKVICPPRHKVCDVDILLVSFLDQGFESQSGLDNDFWYVSAYLIS